MDFLADPENAEAAHERAFRRVLERFARVRSAHRALPDSADEFVRAEERNQFAIAVRQQLSEVARLAKLDEGDESEMISLLANAERDIEAMECDLLARVDEATFAALRASIPGAVDAHRSEVVALAEVIVTGSHGLLDRLSKLEYLLTILCTEVHDGQRQIVHDPVSIVLYFLMPA